MHSKVECIQFCSQRLNGQLLFKSVDYIFQRCNNSIFMWPSFPEGASIVLTGSFTRQFSGRLSAPPSGSHKCLRFGLWLTLSTLKITYLFTYLLTLGRGWGNYPRLANHLLPTFSSRMFLCINGLSPQVSGM